VSLSLSSEVFLLGPNLSVTPNLSATPGLSSTDEDSLSRLGDRDLFL
jgi:hypothetical protein